MSAIVPTQPALLGASKVPAPNLRAVEKSSASSALGQGNANTDNERQQQSAPIQVELVCRDDTPRFDPIWDAPRLVPAFVAQLLGQVMQDGSNAARRNTGYETKSCSCRQQLFDLEI